MNAKPTSLLCGLLAIALAVTLQSCMDGAHTAHQGAHGYPCDAHGDCEAPLLCLDVPDVTFPVCTGSALEGEACSEATACAWIRDDRGLPLSCVAAACEFPADGDAP